MKLRTTLLAAALSGILTLSGCNSTFGGPSASNADPRLTNDEFYVEQSSNLIACGAGAALAGGSCLLLAGDKKAVCIAAAIGGCALGVGANALLDNLRQNYHTREKQLDALAQQMELNRQKAAYMAATAEEVYQEDHKKLAVMQAEIKQNTIDKKKLQQTLARYDGNILVLQDTISYHEKQLKVFADTKDQIVADGGKLTAAQRKQIKECDREIARLQTDIDTLKGHLTSYTRDRDVLNIAANGQTSINAAA